MRVKSDETYNLWLLVVVFRFEMRSLQALRFPQYGLFVLEEEEEVV
jgi:hypothetical protein